MLRFAVINGLNPEIRNHVTRNQPTTWTDLVYHAKVGEMCVPVPSQTDSTLAVKLELIQDQLKQLTAEKAQTRSTSPVIAAVDRPLRSPSPRRVRFQNDRSEFAADRRSRVDDYRNTDGRSYYDRRYDDRFIRPGGNRGYRGNGAAGPQWRQWGQDAYQSQPRGGGFRGRGNFRGRSRPPRTGMSANRWRSECSENMCGKCGRSPHEHPNNCPAINQDCRGCGRKGHFLRVCRTTARMQNMSD